ncbi:MAG: glycosyltransferase family protein [Planctomycetaceae bacterium]|nr:glycosyltransferase family protein [Planctomycetales bacterium]MCB9926694.1 glycosyltransferase family protein [Planctomycetaceae bacterium]
MPTVDEALQLGWRQHQAGDFRNAEHIYRQVLGAASGNANAWCFLGMVCHDQSKFDEAVGAYHKALEIQPNFPIALSNLGNTLKQQGKFEEAEASCREALRLKPDYSTAFNNLGVALVAQGRLEEASKTFEQALALMPNDAVTHSNLSAALVRQGKFAEAEANSKQALSLNPNYAEAHKNQGIVWLLLGDFERGWPEYEWRWNCPGCRMPSYSAPMWQGEPLDGKTILLHHEQGLGDTIQFVRYAAVLKQMGAARVVVKTQKPLMKLLATGEGIDELVCADASLPPFDVHVPMLSVPGILKTNFETIPGQVPYIHPDPNLIASWKQRLAEYDGFKVGISWQGSPDFHADAQRSIPLRHFSQVAAVPGVRLVNFQKGFGVEQIDALKGEFEVIDFGEELDRDSGPFMDTAAIMRNLDLVIAPDTSMIHLAGAVAAPAMIALSLSPDWRWFLKRDDSPWYPTVQLFRQNKLGDWEETFTRIAAAVAKRISEKTALYGTKDAPKPSVLETRANMTQEATVNVEIAPGELIDKITILEIKLERITDTSKLANVRVELNTLESARDSTLIASSELDALTQQLKSVNEQLWDIEDSIRDCEREKDFGAKFIELARAVYKTNDKRAALKRDVNTLLGSHLVEEKSYSEYE